MRSFAGPIQPVRGGACMAHYRHHTLELYRDGLEFKLIEFGLPAMIQLLVVCKSHARSRQALKRIFLERAVFYAIGVPVPLLDRLSR